LNLLDSVGSKSSYVDMDDLVTQGDWSLDSLNFELEPPFLLEQYTEAVE
jgi:hypothetical protein